MPNSQTASIPTEVTSEDRIRALDGVRGLAILLVTLYRFSKDTQFVSELPLGLGHLFGFGMYGVDLFFVLSGFLITGILLKTRNEEGYFTRFFVRRSFRIFPLYFGSLLLFLVLIPSLFQFGRVFEPAQQQAGYLWTYTSNLKIAFDGEWTFGCLDHFWSLAVEEHFYLVWPLVVWFAGRRLLQLTIVGILLAAGSRTLFCLVSSNDVAPEVFTLFRCDGLLLGALVAMVTQKPSALVLWIQRWCMPIIIGGLLFAVASCLLQKRILALPHLSVTLAWSALLLVLATRSQWIGRRWFENRMLVAFGKYSYAMYIFQSPLMPLMRPAWVATTESVAKQYPLVCDSLYLIFMTALCYSLAVVSWYVIEHPLLRLRDQLTAGHPKTDSRAPLQTATQS